MSRRKLTQDERGRAIGMLKSTDNQIKIAGRLIVAESVVCRLCHPPNWVVD